MYVDHPRNKLFRAVFSFGEAPQTGCKYDTRLSSVSAGVSRRTCRTGNQGPRNGHLSIIVRLSALRRGQWLKAVIGQLHVFVAVDFQDVATLFVDGQPPHHVAPVKFEILDDLQMYVGRTDASHMPYGAFERKAIPCGVQSSPCKILSAKILMRSDCDAGSN